MPNCVSLRQRAEEKRQELFNALRFRVDEHLDAAAERGLTNIQFNVPDPVVGGLLRNYYQSQNFQTRLNGLCLIISFL